MSENVGPFTFHFDIRNGDVSATYDKNGNFLFADVIKCGECDSYSNDEEKDFLERMDEYGIDLDNVKNEYIETLKNIIKDHNKRKAALDDGEKRYLSHIKNLIKGLNNINLRTDGPKPIEGLEDDI